MVEVLLTTMACRPRAVGPVGRGGLMRRAVPVGYRIVSTRPLNCLRRYQVKMHERVVTLVSSRRPVGKEMILPCPNRNPTFNAAR